MKKITALVFTILSLLFIFQSPGKAADWYSVTLTREVYLDNTSDYNVINTFVLKNTSDKYLIKSFDYFSPLKFTNAEATVNGKNLNISIVNSHIIIDLGDQVLKPLLSENIVIKLKVPELVKPVLSASGEVLGAELFFPKDVTKYLDIFCQTTIYFDKTQFTPSYISTENKLDEGKLNFTKNVDIYIDFSQIGGYIIKYKGENAKVILPSSVYNNLIYDNIPQDAALSTDTIGNTFLEKSGVIEYELSAFNKDNPNFTGLDYFSKDTLTGYALDQEVKGLYRQVVEKLSPETQTLNTQMQSITEYENRNLNDSLAYSLTLASLINQKEIPAQVVFGKVIFPLSQNQVWHFWVAYIQDGKLTQVDPFMEDLLAFDGFNNISKRRAIISGYFNDANLIASIDNLIKDATIIEFTKTGKGMSDASLARLEVVKVPDSLYPKIKFTYKNLSSNQVTIKGITLNGVFNSMQDILVLPGSQKEFEISLGLNIFDIVLKKGEIKISAQVVDNGNERSYETNTKVPPTALLWIVMINFVSVFVGFALIVIFAKFKKSNYLKSE